MIPDFQSLLRPVLEKATVGERRIGDVIAEIGDDLGLDEAARAELIPSGKAKRFANRVHWARFHLKEAGRIESRRRGHISITGAGREFLSRTSGRITLAQLKAHRGDTSSQRGESVAADLDGDQGLPQTPDEVFREAYGQVRDALKKDLLDRLLENDPGFFERCVVRLLTRMGYGTEGATGEVIGRSGDDGVDGVINQDSLGVDQLYVQAKRYQRRNAVGSGAIRDFFGALALKDVSKGLFITTSDFTQGARETAAKLNARIGLIDGEELADLMLRHHVGCRLVEAYEVLALDEEFFEA